MSPDHVQARNTTTSAGAQDDAFDAVIVWFRRLLCFPAGFRTVRTREPLGIPASSYHNFTNPSRCIIALALSIDWLQARSHPAVRDALLGMWIGVPSPKVGVARRQAGTPTFSGAKQVVAIPLS